MELLIGTTPPFESRCWTRMRLDLKCSTSWLLMTPSHFEMTRTNGNAWLDQDGPTNRGRRYDAYTYTRVSSPMCVCVSCCWLIRWIARDQQLSPPGFHNPGTEREPHVFGCQTYGRPNRLDWKRKTTKQQTSRNKKKQKQKKNKNKNLWREFDSHDMT